MTAKQINLDFSRPHLPIEDEKKSALISFRVGEKFKADLEAVCTAKNVGMSELLYEYSVNGFLDDYKTILLIQSSGKSTLRELLRKG
jgi:hypothetical protein